MVQAHLPTAISVSCRMGCDTKQAGNIGRSHEVESYVRFVVAGQCQSAPGVHRVATARHKYGNRTVYRLARSRGLGHTGQFNPNKYKNPKGGGSTGLLKKTKSKTCEMAMAVHSHRGPGCTGQLGGELVSTSNRKISCVPLVTESGQKSVNSESSKTYNNRRRLRPSVTCESSRVSYAAPFYGNQFTFFFTVCETTHVNDRYLNGKMDPGSTPGASTTVGSCSPMPLERLGQLGPVAELADACLVGTARCTPPYSTSSRLNEGETRIAGSSPARPTIRIL